jgi:hypothetical protein
MMTSEKQRFRFSSNHAYNQQVAIDFLAFAMIELQLFLCRNQAKFSKEQQYQLALLQYSALLH